MTPGTLPGVATQSGRGGEEAQDERRAIKNAHRAVAGLLVMGASRALRIEEPVTRKD
jgi:hypothetical protein